MDWIFKSGSSSGSAADQPVCSDQRVDGADGASTWRLNVTGGGESEEDCAASCWELTTDSRKIVCGFLIVAVQV